MNILTAFDRAWARMSLTPQERAFVRLAEGLAWVFLLAAAGVVMTLMNSGHLAFNQQTLGLVIGAGFTAVMSAAKKYVSAGGDARSGSGAAPAPIPPVPALPAVPAVPAAPAAAAALIVTSLLSSAGEPDGGGDLAAGAA